MVQRLGKDYGEEVGKSCSKYHHAYCQHCSVREEQHSGKSCGCKQGTGNEKPVSAQPHQQQGSDKRSYGLAYEIRAQVLGSRIKSHPALFHQQSRKGNVYPDINSDECHDGKEKQQYLFVRQQLKYTQKRHSDTFSGAAFRRATAVPF